MPIVLGHERSATAHAAILVQRAGDALGLDALDGYGVSEPIDLGISHVVADAPQAMMSAARQYMANREVPASLGLHRCCLLGRCC